MSNVNSKEQPKIMLVDDNEIFLKLFKKYFEDRKYEVYPFVNGFDAISAIENSPEEFDLVILDVIMPEIDGFEVCKRIRQIKDATSLPIIIVTSKSEPKEILQGFELGANDYVSKPFDKEELLVRSKTLIELKNSIMRIDTFKNQIEKQNHYLRENIKGLIQPLQFIMDTAKQCGNQSADFSEYSDKIIENTDEIKNKIENLISLAESNIYENN